jgi:hypothetical protein
MLRKIWWDINLESFLQPGHSGPIPETGKKPGRNNYYAIYSFGIRIFEVI